MELPARVVAICEALYRKHKTLAEGTDNERRQLTKYIAEQCCFELGDKWGTKSTKSSHPQSKDAIAYNLGEGKMNVWDWQSGTSRAVQIKPGDEPDYPNLEGQNFIKVKPVDHLGVVVDEEDDVNPLPNPLPVPKNPDPAPDNGNNNDNEQGDDLISLLKLIIENDKKSTLLIVAQLQGLREDIIKGLNELKAEVNNGVKIRF